MAGTVCAACADTAASKLPARPLGPRSLGQALPMHVHATDHRVCASDFQT